MTLYVVHAHWGDDYGKPKVFAVLTDKIKAEAYAQELNDRYDDSGHVAFIDATPIELDETVLMDVELFEIPSTE